MPNADQLARLTEMGARLVHSCATCSYSRGLKPSPTGSGIQLKGLCHWRRNTPANAASEPAGPAHTLMICNHHERVMAQRALAVYGDLGLELASVVALPQQHVRCAACGWAGLARQRPRREVLIDGTAVDAPCCPRCQRPLESSKPAE